MLRQKLAETVGRAVRGIVFEKRQFFARFDLLTQNDNNLSIKLRKNRE
jgi:hypothetical protein